MKRDIDKQLLEWSRNNRRKPLIIRGARQVGKTYSLKHFGKTYFEEIIYLDFEKYPDYAAIFEGDLDINRICSEIEMLTGQRIIPHRTILLFDEVQNASRALMSLRYFYEDKPDLHVIAAGSLLEFVFSEISVPVGRVQFLYMYPMSFHEFLLARGLDELSEIIQGEPRKLSSVIHNKLITELRSFFFVGGMPECVKAFTESHSMVESWHVQSEIIKSYRLDFSKYVPRINIDCLTEVYKSLSQGIGRQTKYTRLSSNFTIPTIKKAVYMLEKARLVKNVFSVNPPRLPFEYSAKQTVFKPVFLDVGLLQYVSGVDPGEEILKENLLSIYNGAVAEQYVGQELLITQEDDLYYWSRQAKSSSAEVDFIARRNNEVLAIEVKSGVSGTLRSLHYLLNSDEHIDEGIVFSSREFDTLPDQKIRFVPIYYAGSPALFGRIIT